MSKKSLFSRITGLFRSQPQPDTQRNVPAVPADSSVNAAFPRDDAPEIPATAPEVPVPEVSMQQAAPPFEVLTEFLRNLVGIIDDYDENLVPVVRGSYLMRHWFGEASRPAADLDLECFERPLTEEQLQDRGPGGGLGQYDEFADLVDFGKAMCRYAAEYFTENATISFEERTAPADGHSLWSYGTPGERYYLGWRMRRLLGKSGRMQIDIAEPGGYQLSDIAVVALSLTDSRSQPFSCPAYSQEMLLAAKLSWLVRSFTRKGMSAGGQPPEWHGQPKDLFDAHLLLTRGTLDAETFQKCLLVVGDSDELFWNQLDVLFNICQADVSDAHFRNWEPFRAQHAAIVTSGPVEMLRLVAEKLLPMLGDFYQPDEFPFILSINADHSDEAGYLIYADWLEDRADPRAEFLRQYVLFHFHSDERAAEEQTATREAIREGFQTLSQPWVRQLFGTTAVCRQVLARVS